MTEPAVVCGVFMMRKKKADVVIKLSAFDFRIGADPRLFFLCFLCKVAFV